MVFISTLAWRGANLRMKIKFIDYENFVLLLDRFLFDFSFFTAFFSNALQEVHWIAALSREEVAFLYGLIIKSSKFLKIIFTFIISFASSRWIKFLKDLDLDHEKNYNFHLASHRTFSFFPCHKTHEIHSNIDAHADASDNVLVRIFI